MHGRDNRRIKLGFSVNSFGAVWTGPYGAVCLGTIT